MKLHKTNIDKEVYYYFLKSRERRYMYRHKYIDSLGERKEKKKSSFLTEEEAYRSLIKLKASILRNGTQHVENDKLTLSTLVNIFLITKENSLKPETKKSYKYCLSHVVRLIGSKRLSALSPSVYEREFINVLVKQGLKNSTIKQIHKTFIILINFAVTDDLLTKNKFTGIKIPTDDKLTNFLEPSELNILLDASEEIGSFTQHLLLLLLIYTGMRKGEAMFLQWNGVDFKNNQISISGTRSFYGSGTPKSKRSYRTIGIEPFVMELLKKYQSWCKELKLSHGIKLNSKDRVFIYERNLNGVYYAFSNNYLTKLYKYLKRQGIYINKINVHGLRHTHCTILINSNAPPPEIAERLGNSLDLIYRVYSHAFKKIDKSAVKTFALGIDRTNIGAKAGAE